MKKITVFLFITLFFIHLANAQMRYGDRPNPYRTHSHTGYDYSSFTPSLIFSVGYGFPNLDKNQLLLFNNYYSGSVKQTGPVHASLDYQFNPGTSIGVMVAYGKVSVPYYSYNGAPTDPAVFHGNLEDWSIMLNMIRYMQAGRLISPYLRTAIGVNLWNQNYIDQTGNKIINPEKPGMFAYQASLGARFNITEHAGIFIEAGYGKYYASGGLSYKFK